MYKQLILFLALVSLGNAYAADEGPSNGDQASTAVVELLGKLGSAFTRLQSSISDFMRVAGEAAAVSVFALDASEPAHENIKATCVAMLKDREGAEAANKRIGELLMAAVAQVPGLV